MDTDRKQLPKWKHLQAESGVAFSHYRRARRFGRVAVCVRSTMPRLFGKTSGLCCFHVWLFSGNQKWRSCNFDPAARLFKHHVLHHRIGTASRTSAVFVERIHKKAIEAFKCFRWMLDGTNQWRGHFPPSGSATNNWRALRLVPANPCLLLRTWGLYALNKPNVNGFTTSANC